MKAKLCCTKYEFQQAMMIPSTLTQIRDRFDPDQFIKINRGCIINTVHVTKIDTEIFLLTSRPSL